MHLMTKKKNSLKQKGFKRTLIASLENRPEEKADSKTSSKISLGSFSSNMFSEQSTIK